MSIITLLSAMFRVLFTPSCWMQHREYNVAWETKLRQLMSAHKFEPINGFRALIGGVEVWIENHPYGSMSPILENTPIDVRPSRITILEAMDKYRSDMAIRITSEVSK